MPKLHLICRTFHDLFDVKDFQHEIFFHQKFVENTADSSLLLKDVPKTEVNFLAVV